MRQVDGLREDDAKSIVSIRDGVQPELNPHLFAPPLAANSIPPAVANLFKDVRDLWRRSGVGRATLERLAAADAFRSLGHDRRQALWEVREAEGTAAAAVRSHASRRGRRGAPGHASDHAALRAW